MRLLQNRDPRVVLSRRLQASVPWMIWAGLALFLALSLNHILLTPTDSALLQQADGDAPVLITEFMANSDGVVLDEDGDASDWIELYNRSSRPVNLMGWSLTDDSARPDKWQFGELVLDAGTYLIVYASGKDRFNVQPADAGPTSLHSNFSLSSDWAYLALHPPSSRRYLDASVFEYPAQPVGASFGIALNSQGKIIQRDLFFGAPTPGAANDLDSAWRQVWASVEANYRGGYYPAPIQVQLTTDEPGGDIRYTTDGSLPSADHGLTYVAPIEIAESTPLRAAVIKPDHRPGPVMTHTYLFVDDILTQGDAPAGMPATWGVHDLDFAGYLAGEPRAAIYAMDPRIAQHPVYGEMARTGLREIPTLALVMPGASLETLYGNTHQRGIEYEQPVSMEFLHPAGDADFQIDGGVRVHGGAGRWSFMPKHSLRLYFRSEYGASRLRAPLFDGTPVEVFNRLVLRAGSDRSFVGHPPTPEHPHIDHRLTTYTRDEWARASQIAMSGVGSHGLFLHLYINGVYWGLYNLVERLDTDFAASHLGGDATDWFSVTQGGMRPGMPDRFLVLRDLAQAGGLADPERYATFLEFIDPIQFSDYVILQWYSGNRDWPENNWTVNVQYPAGRNIFFVWDSEDTWHDGAEIRLGSDGFEGAPFPNVIRLIFNALWENPEFRLLFADRLYANLAHDGPLTEANAIDRWLSINQTIENAIAAEAARWGYVRYDDPITPTDWQQARDLVTAQMRGNDGKLLALAREEGYYPHLDPPRIGPHGGEFEDSQVVELSWRTWSSADDDGENTGFTPDGAVFASGEGGAEILYTLDGSDPRATGSGAPSAQALHYAAPFELTDATTVKARARRFDPEAQTYVWSALSVADFRRAGQRGDVRISEIMYNPVGGGNFEFVEIINRGEVTVDLSGAFFEGIDFRFQEYRNIGPGEPMVLVRHFPSYRSRYPDAPVHGIYGGRLSNQGETLALRARDGTVLDKVTYGVDGRWPMSANGAGDSLVRRDYLSDPDHPISWQASAVIHGSPGAPDGTLTARAEDAP